VLNGDEWSASHPGHHLISTPPPLPHLLERTPVPIKEEARWAPELVCLLWRRQKSLNLLGFIARYLETHTRSGFKKGSAYTWGSMILCNTKMY